jgi:hypothetical protein
MMSDFDKWFRKQEPMPSSIKPWIQTDIAQIRQERLLKQMYDFAAKAYK